MSISGYAHGRPSIKSLFLSFGVEISGREKAELMGVYRVLPIFSDVKEGLKSLVDRGFRMYAFSNGRAEMVRGLLENSGIEGYFLDVVSVEDVRSFKPDPKVYKHFLEKAGTGESDSWLVSGNPFDVLGAMAVSMNGLWLQRSPEAVFDLWDVEPTAIAKDLTEVPDKIHLYKG